MRLGKFIVAFAFAAAMVGTPGESRALTEAELLEIIERQAEQIDRLTKRVEEIEKAAKSATVKAESATERAESAEEKAEGAEQKAASAQKATEVSDSNVEFKLGPAPTIRSKDGRFEFKVRGRVLADLDIVRSDDNPRNVGGERISTTSTEFRAARLGAEGRAWKDIEYKIETDFADNEVDLKDAFVEYVGDAIDPVRYVRLGQYKTPNSLEEQTSSRFTTFMERAAFTNAFELNRRIGAGTGVGGESWLFDAGLFGQNNDEDDSSLDEGFALAGRGTVVLNDTIQTGDKVHFGAHARFRDLDNNVDDEEVRYRQRPFFHDTNRSVDTGDIDGADNDVLAGVEAAWVSGPLSIQTEAAHTWLQRNGESDADGIWGGYVDASYFLTGESRPYKGGKFRRVKVKDPVFEGGWGAWQIGTRFDYIDLNDDDVRGGKQSSIIAGLNWHLNDHTRMMLDYAYTRVFDARGMGGDQIEGSSNDIHGVGLRAQVDF